jgi:hypothetical protein
MSHSGITPLPEDFPGYEILISGGMLLPSGEANFIDFRQHVASDWDSTTPTGDVYYSASGDWNTRNPNYVITTPHVRHKEYLLTQGQIDGAFANKYVVASGINFPFPYPYNKSYPQNIEGEMFSIAWWKASGVYQTYPEATFLLIDREKQSGILHWEGFRQVENLSNSPSIAPIVPPVRFNKYIHHLPEYPYHAHMEKPKHNIEVPDYSDRRVFTAAGDKGLLKLRDKQKRKYIETEYLSDVGKRNRASGVLSYLYDEEGLFSKNKPGVKEPTGRCLFPDGTCRDSMTQQSCTAYPGAIWETGVKCEDLQDE